MKIIFKWVPFVLLILFYLSVLELNKNTLAGWAAAVLAAGQSHPG